MGTLIETAKSWLRWALAYGFGRAFLRLQARRGNLVARALVDPAIQDDPYPVYEQVRASGPHIGGRAITPAAISHTATKQLLRSGDFGVGDGHGELPPPLRRLLLRLQVPEVLGPVDPPSMLAVDAPHHTRFRRLVSKEFTARAVGQHEERITQIANDLLDRLESQESFDLVASYASLLPVAVISDLLGVPEERRAEVLELGNDAAAALDPGLSWREYRRAEAAIRDLHRLLDEHIDNLRAKPGVDLMSRLVSATEEDQLTDVELHAVALLTLGAGFETTVNLIGTGVVLLDRHRDQLDILRDRPELWPNAVEEILRLEPPVQMTLRIAYADTELVGHPIPKGSAVTAMLAGANRDPEVFTDPTRFDVTRANANDHLTFSAGEHYCVGSGLARLEGTVALRTLFERFPELRVAEPPTLRHTRILRGYEHLPVSVGAVRLERTA
jgi:cytochrome P450